MRRNNPAQMSGLETLAWIGAAGAAGWFLYWASRPSPGLAPVLMATAPVPPAASPPSGAAATIPASAHPTSTALVPAALTQADHDFVKGIQERLNTLGYNAGPLTGAWNHDTAYAIAFFQQAAHLPADGVLRGATAQKLAATYESWISNQPGVPPAVRQAQYDNDQSFWRQGVAAFSQA